MDKFTPGPWRVDDAKMQCNIVSANGEWIAELQGYAPPEQHRDRLWEDARLIAAAPELLEALRECRRFLMDAPLESGWCCCGDKIESHGMGSGHSPVDMIQHAAFQQVDRINAIIAKATATPSQEDTTILSAEAKGGKLWL